MKNRIFAVSLLLAALPGLAGCQTTSSTPMTQEQKDALTAATIEFTSTAIVAPVLDNNPGLQPALTALAESLSTLTGTEPITPQKIAVFVDAFSAKWNLDAKARTYVALGIQGAWTIYTVKTGNTSAPIGDPRTQLFLNAFAKGIRDGITLHGG
jgi:hypothetical protein